MINFDQIPRSKAGYSVIATICSNGSKLPLLLFENEKREKAVKKGKKKQKNSKKKKKKEKEKEKKKYKNVKQILLFKDKNVNASLIEKHVLNNIKEFYEKDTNKVTSKNSFILCD